MLDNYTIDSLTELVGSSFEVISNEKSPFTLTLKDVSVHVNTPNHQNFSLYFQGPLDHFLAQGIYQLDHPTLGSSELFLVPISKDSNGYLYEAVFNLIS